MDVDEMHNHRPKPLLPTHCRSSNRKKPAGECRGMLHVYVILLLIAVVILTCTGKEQRFAKYLPSFGHRKLAKQQLLEKKVEILKKYAETSSLAFAAAAIKEREKAMKMAGNTSLPLNASRPASNASNAAASVTGNSDGHLLEPREKKATTSPSVGDIVASGSQHQSATNQLNVDHQPSDQTNNAVSTASITGGSEFQTKHVTFSEAQSVMPAELLTESLAPGNGKVPQPVPEPVPLTDGSTDSSLHAVRTDGGSESESKAKGELASGAVAAGETTDIAWAQKQIQIQIPEQHQQPQQREHLEEREGIHAHETSSMEGQGARPAIGDDTTDATVNAALSTNGLTTTTTTTTNNINNIIINNNSNNITATATATDNSNSNSKDRNNISNTDSGTGGISNAALATKADGSGKRDGVATKGERGPTSTTGSDAIAVASVSGSSSGSSPGSSSGSSGSGSGSRTGGRESYSSDARPTRVLSSVERIQDASAVGSESRSVIRNAVTAPTSSEPHSLFDFSALDIDGLPRPLSSFRGSVVVVVNVASACGFTESNYRGLVALYERYRKYGLEILAFPCNQFGGQEPDPEPIIQKHVKDTYGVAFPLFSKVVVNGPGSHPLFVWMKRLTPRSQGGGGGLDPGTDITWNFNKFLVDRAGRPRFLFRQDFDTVAVEAAVRKLLMESQESALKIAAETDQNVASGVFF